MKKTDYPIRTQVMNQQEYTYMFHAEETMWWYVGLRNVINYYISQRGTHMRILDAGCGTGKNMQFLKEKGHNVYGIDIGQQAIALCKKRGLKQVYKGSIDTIPFPDSSFDCVVATDVLGVFTDQEGAKKALRELYRVVKLGGLLLLHCSAFSCLHSRHDHTTRILKRYTKKELISLLGKKWVVQKISYRIFFLFFPVAMVKWTKQYLPFLHLPKTDHYQPPRILNIIFTGIQLSENYLLRFIDFPVGSSMIVVARKRIA